MNTNTVEAVIFDRDGVLTEFDLAAADAYLGPLLPLSLWELSARWETHGATVGFPTSVEEERLFFQGYWTQLADEFGLEGQARGQLLAFEYTTCLRAFPEVYPTLVALREYGLRIGVLSNFALASLEESLRATGLADLIDAACAATVIGASKPSPRAYEIAARALGVKPEQCLFFDDEVPCVQGATAVGMRAFHVDRRRDSSDLAAHVVHDLSAALRIIQRINQEGSDPPANRSDGETGAENGSENGSGG